MPSRKLVVEFVGDTKSLERALGRSRNDVDQFGGATARSTKKMDGFRKAAGLAFVGGLGAATVAIKSSVKAAADAQVSQTKMETQLKALGIAYGKHAKHIDAVIQKTSQLSGLDDEDLQDSFTNIVRVTGDVNKALKLNALAADIARARHVSLEAASKAVSKAAGGQAGALGRLGVVVKDGATGQEALAAAQKKFSGQAEAYGKTAAGAQDRFKVAVENLQEALGQGLLPVVTKVANAVSSSVAYFQEHTTQAKILLGAVGALTVGLGVFSVAAKVVTAAQGVATAATWAWNIALNANPISLVIIGLVALGAAFVVAWKKSETFRNIVIGTWNAIKSATIAVWGAVKSFLTGVWGALKAAVTGYFNAYRTVIVGVWSAVKASTIAVWSAIKTVATGAWGVLRDAAGATWGAIRSAILTPIRAARDVLTDVWRSIKDSAAAAWGRMKEGASSFASGLKDSIVGAFKGAANSVIGFVNKIIDVINVIPGVPDIKHVKGLAEGGVHAAGEQTQGFARGGAFAKTGGIVNRPMTFMGEEAPLHPEFVIPTNPAYRGRAQQLLAAAATVLGGGRNTLGSQGARSQGFKVGGVFGGGVDAVLDLVADGGKSLIGKLPNPGEMLPGWLKGLGTWTLEHVKKWITGKISGLIGGPGGDWANVPADGRIAAMVAMANRMQMMRIPYGPQGHAGWPLNPYGEDCSSTVSKVLHAAGYLSNVLTTVGLPGALPHGPGKYVTVHDRALPGATGHTIIQIGSKFFGTSNSNPGGGPGWINPGAGYLGTLPTKLHPGGLAQGGLFGGLPFLGSYHTGGVARTEGLAHVARGETMTPAGMAPEIHVYIGGEKIDERVDVRIVERDRRTARTYRAGVLR